MLPRFASRHTLRPRPRIFPSFNLPQIRQLCSQIFVPNARSDDPVRPLGFHFKLIPRTVLSERSGERNLKPKIRRSGKRQWRLSGSNARVLDGSTQTLQDTLESNQAQSAQLAIIDLKIGLFSTPAAVNIDKIHIVH